MDENDYNSSNIRERVGMITRGISRDVGVKKSISAGAKNLAIKLNEQIEKGNDDSAFMIAILLAGFKDSLDFLINLTLIEVVLPGVGLLIGFFLTSFLFFFMLGKGWFLKWKMRATYWVLGWFFDSLPAFSLLPINTLLVLYAWRITKKRAKKASVKIKNLNNLTEREIEALNNDISLLETEYEKTL